MWWSEKHTVVQTISLKTQMFMQKLFLSKCDTTNTSGISVYGVSEKWFLLYMHILNPCPSMYHIFKTVQIDVDKSTKAVWEDLIRFQTRHADKIWECWIQSGAQNWSISYAGRESIGFSALIRLFLRPFLWITKKEHKSFYDFPPNLNIFIYANISIAQKMICIKYAEMDKTGKHKSKR